MKCRISILSIALKIIAVMSLLEFIGLSAMMTTIFYKKMVNTNLVATLGLFGLWVALVLPIGKLDIDLKKYFKIALIISIIFLVIVYSLIINKYGMEFIPYSVFGIGFFLCLLSLGTQFMNWVFDY